MGREHSQWAFVWIPVAGSLVWSGTLLGMLITWLAEGRTRYAEQESGMAYVSDVGSGRLKPLFITGCILTVMSFVASLSIERWLRHAGRTRPDKHKRKRVLSSLAILSSITGGGALILLSIFDIKRHNSLHQVFLLVFLVGFIFSAMFNVVEYHLILSQSSSGQAKLPWQTSKDLCHIHRLKFAYRFKAITAGILFILAVAPEVALHVHKAQFIGGVIEWTIGFGFAVYLLTFYYDLRLDLARESFDREYTDSDP